MKTFTSVILMLLACLLVKGQDLKSDSTHFTYCQIIGNTVGLKGKPNIKFDFGQTEPTDWELVQAFAFGEYSPGFTYFYILRKSEINIVNKALKHN